MFTKDPYSDNYGLRFPRGEVISAILSDVALLQNGLNHKFQILDIGCGLGSFSRILECLPNSTYLGIDVSGQAINKAKERFPDNKKNRCDFLQIDTLEFVRTSNLKVDIVVDSASLQHHFASNDEAGWETFMLHFSHFLQDGVLYTQWASSANSEMRKRFPHFTGFEQIVTTLKDYFVIETKMIKEVKFPSTTATNGNPVSVVEYIATLRNKG
jgi:cyclopropane fatty-acyl-phospholipid synthase-like methyltransferase